MPLRLYSLFLLLQPAGKTESGDLFGPSLTLFLQDEFGSVLDESLVILIANDRDLATDYLEIRDVLNQLAGTARAEAATGFDPSGLSSADAAADAAEADPWRFQEPLSGDGLHSSTGSATNVSDFSDQSENQAFTGQTNLSDDQKIQELKLVFGARFRDNTIGYVLKQAGGNLERAFDDLLSRQFLDDAGCLPKGVDGFAADEDGLPSKAKAGRAPKGNAKAKKHFVQVQYKAVSSAANDEELEGAEHFLRPTASRGAGSARRAPPLASAVLPIPATTATAAVLSSPTAADFGAADLRTAANLRRMGPLGRQAAAVYTERAREARTACTAQVARAAEAQVNHQSTDTMLDLHGVFVMDGVRIAKQRVWTWWSNLGEGRAALARQRGFTVVTGVGKHSVGGVSRLRQAVGAYLRNDGWRVETLTGSFHVTGRVA